MMKDCEEQYYLIESATFLGYGGAGRLYIDRNWRIGQKEGNYYFNRSLIKATANPIYLFFSILLFCVWIDVLIFLLLAVQLGKRKLNHVSLVVIQEAGEQHSIPHSFAERCMHHCLENNKINSGWLFRDLRFYCEQINKKHIHYVCTPKVGKCMESQAGDRWQWLHHPYIVPKTFICTKKNIIWWCRRFVRASPCFRSEQQNVKNI
jgi:hypothetical protein